MHDPEDEANLDRDVQWIPAEDEESRICRFEAKYWSQLQVLLWICFRRYQCVEAVADLDQDLDELLVQGFLCGSKSSWESAERELLDELRDDRLRAWGLRDGQGDLELIPQIEWARLELYLATSPNVPYAAPHDHRRVGGTRWIGLVFERERVLELWPRPQVSSEEAQPTKKPPEHATLVSFLLEIADGTKSEAECRRAAEEHFGVTITDSVKAWRPAWREVPERQKLKRGQKASKRQ